jgi:hypothetical protein
VPTLTHTRSYTITHNLSLFIYICKYIYMYILCIYVYIHIYISQWTLWEWPCCGWVTVKRRWRRLKRLCTSMSKAQVCVLACSGPLIFFSPPFWVTSPVVGRIFFCVKSPFFLVPLTLLFFWGAQGMARLTGLLL